VITSGICSFLAFLAVRRWGFRGKFGFVHLGLFLGIFLWFLGDLTWTMYENLLQFPIPYPSFADVFYLAAYIPFTVGLFQFLRAFFSGVRRDRFLAALGVGMFFVALTSFTLIGPLVLSTEDLLTKTFDVTYPVLDSILVVLSLLMFAAFKGGKMAGAWVWISLGLLLSALADITFSLGTLQGWYYSGHPIELIQLWGYFALAIGFDEQRGASLVS